jgi:predicted MPP superfamily phosphohydrolase
MSRKQRRGGRWRWIALALLALLTGLGVWAFVVEPAGLRREEVAVAVPRWPRVCDGLRVAVIADLHVGSPFNGMAKVDAIVDAVREARPDMVLLAGDYVIQGVLGGHFVPPETIAPALGRMSAPLGVWAVLGNHDWWLDGPRVRGALEAAGIPVLEDAARPIRRGECAFWLAGIGDFWEARHDVRAALSAVPQDAPVIAFTHNPDVFPKVPARVNLTVAGHTHGGQVRVPFVGRPIVPSHYGERYAIGTVVEEGRHLFVTSGVGTSILPVRFLVPPVVSVMALRAP